MLYAGLDLSRQRLDVHVLDEDTMHGGQVRVTDGVATPASVAGDPGALHSAEQLTLLCLEFRGRDNSLVAKLGQLAQLVHRIGHRGGRRMRRLRC